MAPEPFPPAPLVSVVIPVFNNWNFTFGCLMALVKHTPAKLFETIVVDNGSSDDTRLALPRLDGLRFIRNDTNFGFSKACNQGAAIARGKYLLFLNNDTEPQPGWLEAMLEVVESDPKVAVVGSKLLFPDGTIQHGGVAFLYALPYPISPVHVSYGAPAHASQKQLTLRAVTGACLLIRSDWFKDVGGFDEGYLNGYEDVDLCLKVHARGGLIVYTPQSVVIHHESKTPGRFNHTSRNIERLHQRWVGNFQQFDVDPRGWQAATPPSHTEPVSFVVVTENHLDTIAPCLESLLPQLRPDDEVVVVDNASQDGTQHYLAEISKRETKRVRTLCLPTAIQRTGAVLAGVEHARHPTVALLGPELAVGSGAVEALLSGLKRGGSVAAVGPAHAPITVQVADQLYTGLKGAPPPPVPAREMRPSTLFATRRELLLRAAQENPETLLDREPSRLAEWLNAQGLQFLEAPEVGTYTTRKLTPVQHA